MLANDNFSGPTYELAAQRQEVVQCSSLHFQFTDFSTSSTGQGHGKVLGLLWDPLGRA